MATYGAPKKSTDSAVRRAAMTPTHRAAETRRRLPSGPGPKTSQTLEHVHTLACARSITGCTHRPLAGA